MTYYTKLYRVTTTFLGADAPSKLYFDDFGKAKAFMESECRNGEIDEVELSADYQLNYSDGCTMDDLTYGDFDAVEKLTPSSMSTAELVKIVDDANAWDDLDCVDALTELCNRAGRLLRDRTRDGIDCSDLLRMLRMSAPEFLEGTPDVSDDTSDLIDWVWHGAEQANPESLTYALHEILSDEF